MSEKIRKNDIDDFFDSFNTRHVILYVGQNSNDEELQEYISKYEWSCVITSRNDQKLSSFFQTENRRVVDRWTKADILKEPLLNQKTLPIWRLFGLEGMQIETDDEDWMNPIMDEADKKLQNACEMLECLPAALDPVNPLIMVGATSDDDFQLFGRSLLKTLGKLATNRTVSIWDMPESVEGKNQKIFEAVKKMVKARDFGCYTQSLAEIIRPRKEEQEAARSEGYMRLDAQDDIYYQGHRAVNISQSDLHLFRNVGTLLTERTLNAIRPMGRELSKMWFSNFHSAGSDKGPQWYGYLRQSDFHLKRSFEEALFQVVLRMLEGKNIAGTHEEGRPVILAGHPGSSKSITLAALAYRIYNERVNPVIFLSQDYFFHNMQNNRFKELEKAIQKLDDKGAPDTRVLIIWDSSAYKSGIDNAKQLLQSLKDVGRRCVLVCSSYDFGIDNENGDKEKVARYSYNEKTHSFEFKEKPANELERAQIQVVDREDCCYVRATRIMNSLEISKFWELAREYSGINRTTITGCIQRWNNEGRNDVFDYYYSLISLMRDKLKDSLFVERSRVTPYVLKQIKKAIDKILRQSAEELQNSDIAQKILATGILDQYEFAPVEETQAEQDDDFEEKLDNLTLCVALFSRFKLPVPYRLAYAILVGAETNNRYNAETIELYNLVTTGIPWLYFGQDTEGNFSFRFRNSLEADIHLQDRKYSGENQIELVCRILDIYGQNCRDTGTEDPFFAKNLQALLRQIGPNSEYFAAYSNQEMEHRELLKGLDKLIQKLQELKKNYRIPDWDAGFATIIITFSREYYGRIWNELHPTQNNDCPWEWDEVNYNPKKYEERIERLINGIELAESSAEELQRKLDALQFHRGEQRHYENNLYSLTVENAWCKIRMDDLIEQYKRCCKDFGQAPREDLINRKVHYMELYRQLIPIIISNPTNGYGYNALFTAFIRTWTRIKLSDGEKLQYISQVMQVVETCRDLGSGIMNRGSGGSDELSGRILAIEDISNNQKINLDGIIRHLAGEEARDEEEQKCFELYDEMADANITAVVTYICYKELCPKDKEPLLLKGTVELDEDSLKRAEKVYSFLKREMVRLPSVEKDPRALAMLIRAAWMKYNKTALDGKTECQLTRLKPQNWRDINQLCQKYARCCGDKPDTRIILLYALSEVHCYDRSSNGYLAAADILATLSKDIFQNQNQQRLRTPFMICDENGEPYTHNGTVREINFQQKNGFMLVQGVPRYIKGDDGLRFHPRNLGRSRETLQERESLNGLEVGIGYTCFSVYTKEGRTDGGSRS